jgi:uncharacterized membrane protein YdbT with pleckstrin-like domain
MDALTRLRGIYFFDKLTPEQFEALASTCELHRYVSGDDILKQGEQTIHFFIVDEGHVNLRHTDRGGFEKAIGSKGPGEYFGIKMFTTQEPSEYTFEAVGSATLWGIERESWDRLLEAQPNFLDNLPELRAEFARLTRGLDWLSPGEVIDFSTRRHWWALVLMIRLPLIVALVFGGAYAISNAFGVSETLPQVFYVFLGVMVLVLLWLGWEAINWYNDTYIVTNKRVVRINKVVFFSDSRQDLPIEKIQSQRVERGGPISVLLNIADLRITTASAESSGIVFEQVGNVARIQQAIENERLHVAERNRAMERERLRHQIAGEIHHYVFQEPNPGEPTAAKSVSTPAPIPAGRRLAPRRPGRVAKPVPLGKRVGSTFQNLFGTEIRQGNTVTWRKHRIVLLQQIGSGLAMLTVVTLLLVFFLSSGVPFDLVNNGVYAALVVLITVAVGIILWEWEDWRRDLYRLSDVEIVDTESRPFGLSYQEKKAEIRNIQDVTASRLRFLNVLLDYGNVDTRVAGNAAPFTFTNVARPRLVADEIAERIETLKLRNTERVNREQTRSIVDAIIAYHRLVTAERFQQPAAPAVQVVTNAEDAGNASLLRGPGNEPPEPDGEILSAPQLSPPLYTDDGEFPSEADLSA